MGYVIAAIILLLIVAAGVTFLMLNATRRQGRAAATDSEHGGGTPGSDAAIMAPDDQTPLGDTDQHSGAQTREGKTVGGEGEPARAGAEGGVGGEGEGAREVTPESERLADRGR
jgi:hypothetical protein